MVESEYQARSDASLTPMFGSNGDATVGAGRTGRPLPRPTRLPLYLALAYLVLVVYASLYPFANWRHLGVAPLDFLERGGHATGPLSISPSMSSPTCPSVFC